MEEHALEFEGLDAYRLAVEVARWLAARSWPVGMAHLKDQAMRAAHSLVLNLAEGWTRRGQAGRNQLRIARASAAEMVAVLDLAEFPDGQEQQHKLRRIAAMLYRMQRS